MTEIEFLKELEQLINKREFDCCLIVLTSPARQKCQVVRVNPETKTDATTFKLFDAITDALTESFPLEKEPAYYNKDFQQPKKN